MRGLVIAAVALGGTVLAAGGWWLYLVKQALTGDPQIDSMLPRVAFELARKGLLAPAHLRACAAILHMEHSDGAPTSNVHSILEPGDLDTRKGPSVGPGQVLRETAIELGLWPSRGELGAQLDDQEDRSAYLAFGTDPANLGELLRWVAVVYSSKLASAKTPAAAVELYNGAGPKAVAYRGNANLFALQRFGSELA